MGFLDTITLPNSTEKKTTPKTSSSKFLSSIVMPKNQETSNKVAQYQAEQAQLAEESKRANSLRGLAGNTLKDFGGKIKNTATEVKDVAKEFPGAVKQVATETVTHPIKTAQSVLLGGLNVGADIVNLANKTVGLNYKLPKAGDEIANYIGNNSDTQNALRGSAEAVSGYELGGAATKGLGMNPVLNRVVGNVAGGQVIADPDSSFKDRKKQAAFDAAFGLGTEAAGALIGKIKPKPEPALKLPVKSESIETKIPIKSQKIIPEPDILKEVRSIRKPGESALEVAKNLGKEQEFKDALGKATSDLIREKGFVLADGKTTLTPGLVSKETQKSKNKLDRNYENQVNSLANNSSLDDMVSGKFEKQQVAIKNSVYGEGKLLEEKQTLSNEIKEIKNETTYNTDETAQRMVKAREKSISIIDNQLGYKAVGETPKAIEPTPTTKASKVGKSIEAKTVEKGLSEGFGETAGYEPITIKDQALRASNLMNKDFELAKKMVKGEVPMEAGLKGEMLIKAMEDHAQATGDVKLLQDIASSPLVSETSAHAQAMRILAERNPDSVVAKLREVKLAREAKVANKDARKNVLVKKLKGEKLNIPKEELAWDKFLNEITC